MGRRPEATKALEKIISAAMQEIRNESCNEREDSFFSVVDVESDWYGPRLLTLFPKVVLLSQLLGGRTSALPLILRLAELASLDLESPKFTFDHLRRSSFWIDLDKLALQILVRTSPEEWKMLGKGGIMNLSKKFDDLAEKAYMSVHSAGEGYGLNPILSWTVDFLTKKDVEAAKGTF